MNKELKCIICGAIATTFFWAHNDPLCESCHQKLESAPHAVEIRYLDRNPSGVQIVTNITSAPTTITVSTTSTTTTTQPPELT